MLKELVVISGKGGTGKTSIVAALASLIENKVLADCDVDAADLHLVLNPQTIEEHEFWSGKTAFIHRDKCLQCGQCLELCRFAAIGENYIVDKTSCEGCGVCVYFCPAGAIDLKENMAGHWFVSTTPYGTMTHARLGIAEENSGKLVTLVKNQARRLAAAEKKEFILIDGSPGIGCPVIASISGASLVLIVTEPTLSGIHDLERVVSLTKHFKVRSAVCINKADLNPPMTHTLTQKCQKFGLEIVGVIPYDNTITQAQVQGMSIVEFAPASAVAQKMEKMAASIRTLLSTH
jgi:MinD superfamily P-loop ATPase